MNGKGYQLTNGKLYAAFILTEMIAQIPDYVAVWVHIGLSITDIRDSIGDMLDEQGDDWNGHIDHKQIHSALTNSCKSRLSKIKNEILDKLGNDDFAEKLFGKKGGSGGMSINEEGNISFD